MAITDFYTPPEIKEVNTSNWNGCVGDIITILATDDFRVEKVMVEIWDSSGKLLESVLAQQLSAVKWACSLQQEYTAGNLFLKVSASDKPGNITVWQGEHEFSP